MFFLKEDTAVDIKLGPFVDKTDGVTYEVGMAAAMDNATTGVRLSKNGAAFGDRNEATEPVYDAFGYYLVKLDVTDTNTPGRLKVIFGDAAVCLPCEANFQVVNANVFDSLLGAAAADYLQVDTIQVGGTTQTANDVGADADAILVDTAVIGAAGAGLTAVPWNASWDAEVQSEVDDALGAAIADSIPADGTIPSVKQGVYMLVQFMLERSVSSTTLTVKKADGSTSLLTCTLNDATSPTSITRAS